MARLPTLRIDIPESRIIEIILEEEMSRAEAFEFCRALKRGDYSPTTFARMLWKHRIRFGKPGRKSKIERLPSAILERIKQLRREGWGYRYIARRITNEYGEEGWYLSKTVVEKILKHHNIDELIKRAEERELRELEEIDSVMREVNQFYNLAKKKWHSNVSFETTLEGHVVAEGIWEYDRWYEQAEREVIERLKKKPAKLLARVYMKSQQNELIWRALIEKVTGRQPRIRDPFGRPYVFLVKFVK
ncbi:MAG: hypothetical protein XD40_0824 [Archaeoglobus fulgidus]|uniref:Uncharacterized protein n=1 Tax=Archaeoglobus fulgidus TaxID=2234 RepID=A0A117KMA6_ARCFL|nr:hypothetical protein [Archaeoglobus fulgidus]KUJ94003.1 MAG: hypothetical protein XD40_0824 [Archaeoglobus fulgidus]KUK07033.1 MAG: hypothetical protein XD48_0745 [Archaeoglobus fulgidus]